jgi:hypothetical protein
MLFKALATDSLARAPQREPDIYCLPQPKESFKRKQRVEQQFIPFFRLWQGFRRHDTAPERRGAWGKKKPGRAGPYER